MLKKDTFPSPLSKAVFYDDKKLYACLANYPIAKGHSVVVWKEKVIDLHLLKKKEYEHLMNVVDRVRNLLLKILT